MHEYDNQPRKSQSQDYAGAAPSCGSLGGIARTVPQACGPLTSAIHESRGRAGDVMQAISSLASKLDAVLSPVPPESANQCSDKADMPSCDLHSGVSEVNSVLSTAVRALERLYQRVQI